MELREFVIDFFMRLGCKISGESILKIEEVPKEFESLYAKKAPYYFFFDKNIEESDAELIVNSSPLINTINKYLKNKANVTLLRLVLNEDLKNELSYGLGINEKNIIKIDKNEKNDYIFRFTFESSLQYLNENEKIISEIYIHDKDVIDNFSISRFKTQEGKQGELDIREMSEEIIVAKNKVQEILKSKLKDITRPLEESLKKETKRIEYHYKQLAKEGDEQIKKAEDRIHKLSLSEDEKSREKIARLKETINTIKSNIDPVKLEKDKEMDLKNEKQKHTLNLNTALLNKTIIYYPLCSLDIYIQNSSKVKKIDLQYNPLTKRIYGLKCDSCKKEIKDLQLCSSNHIICNNCKRFCSNCHSNICSKCFVTKCNLCNRDLCSNCEYFCKKCRKKVCYEHSKVDFIDNQRICTNCSGVCSVCNKATDKSFLRNVKGKLICSRCFNPLVN